MEVIGRVKEHIKSSSSSLLLYNVSRTVLANNNSAQDIPSGRSRKNLRVPVLNMSGKPLMPTSPRKARILLKQGKATVVQKMPFTIQLKYPSGETKQDITLDINDRYSTIGFSAITEKSELISGELTLRKGISKLLEQKRNYRRVRRNKLLHRKPRLNNRSKHKCWLASGIHHKFNTHLRLIEKLKEVLPITKVIVEVSAFDTQKLQNPEIRDVKYQQEELQGHGVIEDLLEKWKHKVCLLWKGWSSSGN
ncbi:hypothetical protein IPdc08_00666 [archaeon]|nr:hypothetical protein IPdc08_00666 [archaeon]